MGKKLKRLKGWLPWADRAVGAPGAVEDWKELLKSLWPGGGTVPLWFEAVRGWIVDNTIPEWVLLGLAYLGMGTTAVMLFRWSVRQHRRAQRRAQAEEAVQRLRRKTWHVAGGETEIDPHDAYKIVSHEDVGYVLVEEFIKSHPELAQAKEMPRFDRTLFLTWLACHRTVETRSNQPLLATPKDDDTP